MSDLAVVPSTPLLLSEHASLVDPVPQVRTAALRAAAWLVARATGPVLLVCAEPLGARVGRDLLAAAGWAGPVDDLVATAAAADAGDADPLPGAVLAVADGTARRGPDAPGGHDPRAAGFDERVEQALRDGDPGALSRLDQALARELLCAGAPVLRLVGRVVPAPASSWLDLAEDPFGVRYWVARWQGGAAGRMRAPTRG